MSNKLNVILAFSMLIFNFQFLTAQDKSDIKHARQADKVVQDCIQNQQTGMNIEADFSIYDWAKNLQKLVGEVLYKENADVLIEIADEEETVRLLCKLSKNCDVLMNMGKEFQKLLEIYDESIKDQENTKINPNEGFQSSRKVTFSDNSTRKMKAQINSIVNRLEGDNSIFRKLR